MNFAQAAPEAVTTVIATSAAVPTDIEGTIAVEATVTSATSVVTTTTSPAPEAVTTAVTSASDSPEWWQSTFTPLGYIIAASIAAYVAVKLARKTPHENLKALVEIRQTLDEDDTNLDENDVLDEAIRHELNNIGELIAARDEGFFSYVKAIVTQGSVAEFLTRLIPLAISGLLVAILQWLN